MQIRRIVAVLIFVASLVTGHWSFSQATSPYSRYGLGYVRSTVFSANKAMGEVAAPYASSVNINFTNPASYASLTRTTVEIGANFDGVRIFTRDSTYRANSASINHFALAFVPNPKRNAWAISIGLLPYTNINYTFIQNFNDTNSVGSYREIFSGKGSLYQAYAGGAYKVKGFSVGANAGFLFGKLDYQKTILFPDSVGAYGTRNLTNMNLKSFVYSVGIQYQRRIFHNNNEPDVRNDIFVTVGAYGSGGMKMQAKLSNYWERFSSTSAGFEIIDTIQGNFDKSEKVTLPFNMGLGVMFGNERFWMLGTDFKFMNWKKYDSPLNNAGLSDSWRFSFGAQITPRYDDRKFFNRVQYRLGGYYGQSEINFNGKSLNETGGTVGLGIPFKSAARLNVTGDFGTRGGSDKSAIRETYYRFTLGFVVNDIWFIKRKFD
ncbi:MAG: hypothetical protein V4615_16520 [Bacteroidota bacterium]